jgi:hypothetical protein
MAVDGHDPNRAHVIIPDTSSHITLQTLLASLYYEEPLIRPKSSYILWSYAALDIYQLPWEFFPF